MTKREMEITINELMTELGRLESKIDQKNDSLAAVNELVDKERQRSESICRELNFYKEQSEILYHQKEQYKRLYTETLDKACYYEHKEKRNAGREMASREGR